MTINKLPAPLKSELEADIYGFLLFNFSENDRKSMTASKSEETGDPVEAGAAEILRKIRITDPTLDAKIVAFTPHPSCQASLVREVLVELRLLRTGGTAPSWKRPKSSMNNQFDEEMAVA